MVKRVHIFSLAEGNDQDEAWKYWIEIHATNFKKLPGIRKYVLNRVTKEIKRRSRSGDAKFWGLVEMWFDSEEAGNQAFSMWHPKDAFGSMICDPQFAAWVEEKVMV